MKTRRKNRLVITFQDCGGKGKTDLSKNIGDWYTRENRDVAIIDAEIAVKGAGMIRAYFPNATWLDIQDTKQFDGALLTASKQGTALCDVGANAGQILKAWLKEMGTEELDNLETDLTLAVPITAPEPASISLFDWIGELPADQFDLVVAKNEKDGKVFTTYDNTKDGQEFQKKYNPHHILIEERPQKFEGELVARRLTMLQAVTLFQAGELALIGNTLSDPLTNGRIQRIHLRVMEQLDTIAHLLRP